MTLLLKTGWLKKEQFTLFPETIVVEEQWGFLHHRDEFPYRTLVSRSTPVKPSLAAAFILFLVLLALPAGAAWFAWFVEEPAFQIATLLLCVPALIGLREVVHSFRRELLFLEKGDGGVTIRFRYRKREAEKVDVFARELRKCISQAKKNREQHPCRKIPTEAICPDYGSALFFSCTADTAGRSLSITPLR